MVQTAPACHQSSHRRRRTGSRAACRCPSSREGSGRPTPGRPAWFSCTQRTSCPSARQLARRPRPTAEREATKPKSERLPAWSIPYRRERSSVPAFAATASRTVRDCYRLQLDLATAIRFAGLLARRCRFPCPSCQWGEGSHADQTRPRFSASVASCDCSLETRLLPRNTVGPKNGPILPTGAIGW